MDVADFGSGQLPLKVANKYSREMVTYLIKTHALFLLQSQGLPLRRLLRLGELRVALVGG